LNSLGSLFNRQPAPLLGLDISSSSVKLVELGRDREGQYVLERCAIEPLERGAITDGNVEKFDEVADAIRRVVNTPWLIGPPPPLPWNQRSRNGISVVPHTRTRNTTHPP